MNRLERVALCPSFFLFDLPKEDVKRALRKRKISMKLRRGQLHIYKRSTGDLFDDFYNIPGAKVYIIGRDFDEARKLLNEIRDLVAYVSDDEKFIFEYNEHEKKVLARCNGRSAKVTIIEQLAGAISIAEQELPCTACNLLYCPLREKQTN